MLASLKLYQFVVLAISLVMIAFGIQKFFGHAPRQSFLKLAARLLIWGGMAVVALFPQISNQLAHFIGLEGNVNAVILTGFLLVFLLIFKILSVVERIEQKMSTISQQEALSALADKKSDKDN